MSLTLQKISEPIDFSHAVMSKVTKLTLEFEILFRFKDIRTVIACTQLESLHLDFSKSYVFFTDKHLIYLMQHLSTTDISATQPDTLIRYV